MLAYSLTVIRQGTAAAYTAVLEGRLRKAAWSKCPRSAPVPLPGSSGWLGAPRGETGPLDPKPLPQVLELAASHPKPPIAPPLGPFRQGASRPLCAAAARAPAAQGRREAAKQTNERAPATFTSLTTITGGNQSNGVMYGPFVKLQPCDCTRVIVSGGASRV